MKSTLLKSLAALAIAALVSASASAAEGWSHNYKESLAKAKAEKKLLLAEFTGSDWCPPCKNLHKTVLTAPEFLAFAKDNLVLVDIDFPNSKPQSAELKAANKELAKKFGVTGYPTVIVLDASGKELFKKVGYGGTPAKAYVADLAKLKQ